MRRAGNRSKLIIMAVTTEDRTGSGRASGFRGTRNEDTSAATEGRKRKALERRLQAAAAMLTEHGYTVTPPDHIL